MRVALYVRVSTEEQAEEGFSIEGQINSLTDHAERQGWSITTVYKDEGISGSSLNRPNLQRLLDDAISKSFDMVMVWRFQGYHVNNSIFSR